MQDVFVIDALRTPFGSFGGIANKRGKGFYTYREWRRYK